MNLEDRIKHTGEHLLGSLEYDPRRSDRISERIVVRARQRRQRAATGLGAGVVVVIGGLIGISVDRPAGTGTVAQGSARAAFTVAEVVATTVGTFSSSTTVAESTTVLAATTSSEAAVVPDATVVTPIAGDAPRLFSSGADGKTQAIDLASGMATDTGDDAAATANPLGPATPRRSDATESIWFQLAEGVADECGQRVLSVADSGGTPIDAALPPTAAALLLSDDGQVGLLQFAECTDPANVVWQIASFRTAELQSAIVPLSFGDWPMELSSDGRFALVGDDDSLALFDLSSGASLWRTAVGCDDLRADPSTGYLTTAAFAAIAWCDGAATLLLADLPAAPEAHAIDGCGTPAVLAIRDHAAHPAESWIAVHDPEAGTAWVVSPHGVSEAIPVGEHVWWEAPVATSAG